MELSKPGLQFEALSYVWGAPEAEPKFFKGYRPPELAICLDGHQLAISANLGEALRAHRFRDAVRTIWVDAICINQNDAQERGHQVTLMSAIYMTARQVVVWLGEAPSQFHNGTPDSGEGEDARGERAFGAICDVVNHWLETQSTSYRARYRVVSDSCEAGQILLPSSRLESVVLRELKQSEQDKYLERESVGESGLQEKKSSVWDALSLLFDRSWFWRLWVFQEIVLARAAVFRMGHAEINWQWLGLAAAILRTNYHAICDELKLGGVYNAYLMFRSSAQSDLPPVKFEFLRLLRLTRQFEVTDPRDRIYGLLGLTTDDNEPNKGRLVVRPDYTISTGELWKRLAVTLLTNTEDLSLLSCVQYSADKLESKRRRYEPESMWGWTPEQDKEKVAMPSWVPQWNHVFCTTLSPWDQAERFSAAQGMPRNLGKPVTLENLVLQGIEIGVIGHALPYMWHEADISLLQSSHLKEFFKNEAGLGLLACTLTAGRNAYGSILQRDSPALADLAAYILSWQGHEPNYSDWHVQPWYGPRKPQQARGRINRVVSTMESAFLKDLVVGGDANRFAETAMQYCECRRLFLTMNGYLGLGPDTLREGDVLCVLGGGDMPFILRPMKQQDSFERQYLFIGECYVEGLMQGQAVKHLDTETPIFGPIPPELILQTIFETAGERTERSMWVSHSQFEEEYNEIQQLLSAARREELNSATKVQIPRKRWFEIC